MSIEIPKLLLEWFVAGFGFALGGAVCGFLLGGAAGIAARRKAP